MTWSDRAKVRFGILLTVVLLISGSYTLDELRYALFASTAPGQITELQTVTNHGRYGSTSQSLRVHYQFADPAAPQDAKAPAGLRTETDEMALDWLPPDDGGISVQYIPGHRGSSRIAGHTKTLATIPFAIGLVVAGIALTTFLRGYYAHQAAERLRAAMR